MNDKVDIGTFHETLHDDTQDDGVMDALRGLITVVLSDDNEEYQMSAPQLYPWHFGWR